MFARKYLIKVLATILSSVLSFASLMVMTRYVGSEYGVMMWGFSFIALFNALSDLGFASAHIKKMTEGEDCDRCITTFVLIKVALIAVATVAVLITLLIQGFMGYEYSKEMKIVVVSFVVYYAIFNLTGIMTTTYLARMEAGKESAVLVTESAVRSAFLIIFAVIGVSASVLSASYIIGAVSSLTVCLMMFRSVGYKPKRPLIVRKYVSFAAPLAVACILTTAINNLDRVLIGIYYGSEDVGFYSAAMGVIYAMTVIGTVVGGLLLSHFSTLNSESRKDDMKNTFWTIQRYTMMLMLPIVVFFIVFGVEASAILFGEGFSEAGNILSVLVISVPITMILTVNTQLLASLNKTYVYGKIAIIYSIIIISMFMLTIPENLFGFRMLGMGTIGAAVSVVVGNFAFLAMTSIASAKTADMSVYPKIYLYMVAMVASLVVAYLIDWHTHVQGIISVFFALILTVAAYFSVLIVTKEFSKNDIRFMLDIIGVRNTHADMKEDKR